MRVNEQLIVEDEEKKGGRPADSSYNDKAVNNNENR